MAEARFYGKAPDPTSGLSFDRRESPGGGDPPTSRPRTGLNRGLKRRDQPEPRGTSRPRRRGEPECPDTGTPPNRTSCRRRRSSQQPSGPRGPRWTAWPRRIADDGWHVSGAAMPAVERSPKAGPRPEAAGAGRKPPKNGFRPRRAADPGPKRVCRRSRRRSTMSP